MDLTAFILELRNDPLFVTNFVASVVRLFDNMVTMHGVYQGTQEAVVAEAQGAQLLDSAGRAWGHLGSLQESIAALRNREGEINSALARIGRIHAPLAQRVREIVQPLLNQAANTRAIMMETEATAAQLARTAPTRLQGVGFGTGGLGPEIIRNESALISRQLEVQAVQLRARGIQPNLLPDAAATRQFLMRIREVGVNSRDSVARLLPILATMRMAISRTLLQASAATRALLSTILEPLGVALEFLATRLGGLLVTPIIVPTDLFKSLRLERDDHFA